MRCNHKTHSLPSFPVYSLGWLSDDKVVLGGGGGAGRSGIKNKLRLYAVSLKELNIVDELELDPNEDAPMSMAVNPKTSELVCGINSSETQRLAGDNQNCRVFGVDVEKRILSKKHTASTLKIMDEAADDYQKVTAFSPTYDTLGVGCTNNEVSFLSYPSLAPTSQSFSIPKSGGDIFDLGFYKNYAVVCGSKAIYFLTLPPSSSSQSAKKKKSSASSPPQPPVVATTLELPTIPGVASGTSCSFRSARVLDNEGEPALLYAVVNTIPPRSARGGKRSSYVCVYQQLGGGVGEKDSDDLKWTLLKTRSASGKAITVFDVNAKGTLLAYGSSDLSIGVLDAKTLAPVVSILNAHEFPATVLGFNPAGTLLVSGSADNSVRVMEVPVVRVGGETNTTMILLVILAVLALLAAVLLRQA